MESLKEPPMLISTISLAGTVGLGIYLKREIEALRLDVVRLNESLKNVGGKLNGLEKGASNHGELIRKMNKQVSTINGRMGDFEEAIESLPDDLCEITEALRENAIEVELASEVPKRRNARKTRTRSKRKPEPKVAKMSLEVVSEEEELISQMRNSSDS